MYPRKREACVTGGTDSLQRRLSGASAEVATQVARVVTAYTFQCKLANGGVGAWRELARSHRRRAHEQRGQVRLVGQRSQDFGLLFLSFLRVPPSRFDGFLRGLGLCRRRSCFCTPRRGRLGLPGFVAPRPLSRDLGCPLLEQASSKITASCELVLTEAMCADRGAPGASKLSCRII